MGGARAQQHAKTVLLGMGTPVFPWPELLVGASFKKVQDGVLTDEPTRGNYAYLTAVDFTCGLTIHGDLRCSGAEDYLPDSAKSGIWVHADVSDVLTCAVGWPDGELTCWSDSDDCLSTLLEAGATLPPTGAYRQVSVGLFHASAITVDGEMECWGDNDFGETDPPL